MLLWSQAFLAGYIATLEFGKILDITPQWKHKKNIYASKKWKLFVNVSSGFIGLESRDNFIGITHKLVISLGCFRTPTLLRRSSLQQLQIPASR